MTISYIRCWKHQHVQTEEISANVHGGRRVCVSERLALHSGITAHSVIKWAAE